MGMVKATSMRSRMDIRNMPDNGEKAILVTKWQRSWLNCEGASEGAGCLAKDISKPTIGSY